MAETQLDRIENMLKMLTLPKYDENSKASGDIAQTLQRVKSYEKKPVGTQL